jgi:hypothetical protein
MKFIISSIKIEKRNLFFKYSKSINFWKLIDISVFEKYFFLKRIKFKYFTEKKKFFFSIFLGQIFVFIFNALVL